jgi:hypothetical protein
VVALNSPQLDALGGYVNGVPSSCFESITISYNGMTQVATIEDGRCFSLPAVMPRAQTATECANTYLIYRMPDLRIWQS